MKMNTEYLSCWTSRISSGGSEHPLVVGRSRPRGPSSAETIVLRLVQSVATHQALQIQEIVLIIFDHIHPPYEEGHSSDLSALARTCRAFKEPALDVLLEELDDPTPLVRCLPRASRYSDHDKVKMVPSVHFPCLTANVVFPLFHEVLFINQTACTNRVGHSSGVTHVAFEPYGPMGMDSTGSLSGPSQTLLALSYSS